MYSGLEKVGVPKDLDKFGKQFKQYYRNCSFSKMGVIQKQ